jgi:hypothetical protein
MRRLLCGVLVVAGLGFAPAAVAAPIGLQSLEVSANEAPPVGHELNALGPVDTQAGSHPYELMTGFLLSKPEEFKAGETTYFRIAGGGLKDVRVELPPGFVGDPNATPKCAYHDLVGAETACPDDTAIGEATTKLSKSEGYENEKGEKVDKTVTVTEPVYNMETPGGTPFEVGFIADGIAPIFLDASVRTGGDYGITVNARNVPESVAVYGAKVRIWGVPADPSHDPLRGKCLGKAESLGQEEEREGVVHNEEESLCEAPGSLPAEPLLMNPTSCKESRSATLSVDSWGAPGVFASKTATLPQLTGCEKLDFSPTLSVTPDGTGGSTPTGLNVDLHIPQESTTNPVGLGEADVKDISVALPPGVQVSPSAADGLQACSLSQIGFKGMNPVTGVNEFTSELPKPLLPGINFCPDASKIATVRIATPILEHELTGAVYLAAPQNFLGGPLENPFKSLIAMYLVADEPITGVLVKLPGKVTLTEAGQIIASFENVPQAPVGDSRLEFFGTDRAPLATPASCGTYTTTAALTPWSVAVPAAPGEIASPSSSFQVTSGPNGSSCASPLPFAPSLTGGSTNIQAGGFSPLTTTITREDGQQSIQSVQLHFPPGLQGILGGVKLCPEAQANAGTCGSESLVGETIVSVGLGNDPFTVTGGKVYLTEKYGGAPFGLSIVNPANAGPFVLEEGRPVVVRGKLELDSHTTALTFTSNTEAQGHAIPHILDGIPLQIKHVNVTITRPGFTFNPTSCDKMAITGSVGSDEGASSPVSVPFQVTNCTALGFSPVFTATTSGKTSRTNGTSLTLKVTRASGPGSGQANFARAKITLPKRLPARLTTLRKACTSAQFETNPAGCPAPSVVGHVRVLTPALPVPLEGPAYFVSHGGEAYPNLVFVLQGYGVTVDVISDTFISKANVTTGTLNAVPDAPFTSFELTLPAGPYSVFTNDGSLCKPTLVMPTSFLAQNGTEVNQNTKVKVTGCAKKKPTKKATKRKGKRTRKK